MLVHPSQSSFKGFLTHVWCLNSEKKLEGVNRRFLSVFEKEIVCPSVCLAFFESADARDLGLTTLFLISLLYLVPIAIVEPSMSESNLQQMKNENQMND